jgi:uncharacterized protein (DUF1800 family)
MADQQPAPHPYTRQVSRPADPPLIDLIFPSHDTPGPEGHRPTIEELERRQGFGRPDSAAHRKGRRARAVRGDTDGAGVRRRRLLLGVSTGVVAAAGAGTAVALLSGGLDAAAQGGAPGARHHNTAEGLGAAGLADSAQAAADIAQGATPSWPSPLARDPVLHLLRRATFGPTLVDVLAARQLGLDAWLERQLDPGSIPDPEGDAIAALYPTISMSTAQIRAAVQEFSYDAMYELGHATLARQMWSGRQLFEVMVDFWANHLNVTNPFDGGWDIRNPYDADVIRAYALGRYSDMLQASARAPAMLRYLNNADSHKKSVNENYGRELLELHTVGVDARYTETDVRQSAYIMTGRTVDDSGAFMYNARQHWTGPVKVLGFTHANATGSGGLAVGDAYLTYLATHPSTARRIATKLAMRFVCDEPPTTLVDRLAQSYLDNGTAIVPVLRTLFRSVEFWMSDGLKTRRPLENVVAAARVLGVGRGTKTRDGVEGLYWLTNQLGQAPLGWVPPNGYADTTVAWASAHATLGVWNGHRALLQGWNSGLEYAPAESFVGSKPATVGAYLDTLAQRLVFQKLPVAHRQALLTFLGAKETTTVKDIRLGGKIDHLAPLLLDSVYHALR